MIIDFLSAIDKTFFLEINHLPHNAFFNLIAQIASAGSGFIWFFLISIVLVIKDRLKGRVAMLGIIVSSIFTQIVVTIFIKPFIARPRPDILHQNAISVYNPVDSIVPFLYPVKDFSFPSGHATIAFAGAFVLAQLIPEKRFIWYLLAFCVAFSRIYLGKHFPSDVVAGAILGLVIGWLALRVVNKGLKLCGVVT